MTDIATLGLAVDSSQITAASAALNKFQQQAASANASAANLGKNAQSAFQNFRNAANQAQQGANGFANAFKGMQAQAANTNMNLRTLGAQLRIVGTQAQTGFNAVVNAATRMSSGISGAVGSIFTLKHALVGLGIELVVHKIVEMTDSYINLTSRMKLVTKDADDQALVMKRLFETAQETRVNYEELVSTYVRVRQATMALGMASEDSLKLHKSMSLAIQQSGASAQEAMYGLLDLTHALQTGTVQWMYLRRIMVQTPGVVQSVARGLKELGVITKGTTKEVQDLAHHGKLSTELWIAAEIADLKTLEERWTKFPMTVSGAMTVLHNTIFKALGEATLSTGFTQKFAGAVLQLNKVLESPSFKEGVQAMLVGMANLATQLATLISRWDELLIRAKAWVKWFESFKPASFEAQSFAGTQGAGKYNTGMLGLSPKPGSPLEKIFDAFSTAGGGSLSTTGKGGGTSATLQNYAAGTSSVPAPSVRQQIWNDMNKELAELAVHDNIMTRLMAIRRPGGFTPGEPHEQLGAPSEADKAMSAQAVANAKQSLDVQTKANEALQAQLAGNDKLAHQLTLEAKIRTQIDDDLQKQHPEIANAMRAQLEMEDQLQLKLKQRQILIEGLGSVWQTVAGQMQTAMDNFIETGTFHWKEFIAMMLKELDKVLFKLAVIDPLTRALTGGAAGDSGLLGKLAGSIAGSMMGSGAATPATQPGSTAANGWFYDQPVMHRGGWVGMERHPMRSVDSMLFHNAPRLHSGLASDEYPAILQRGERVIPRDGAGGSGTVNNFTVVNQVAGTQVTEERKKNSTGGLDVKAIIRKVVSEEMSDPASSVHKTTKSTFGLGVAGIRR